MATAQLQVGTSGWSYPSGFGTWKGIFYPKRWNGDELAYYAERFPAVEVNSSFYRIPAAEITRGWAERTPPHFRFAVKLFRKFTHPEFYAREEQQSPEITPDDVMGMRVALDALAERGRLGAVLVQYADFFARTDANLSSLVRTLDFFRDYPLAVEFRHRSWHAPQTREVLEAFHAAYVRVDEPCYQSLDQPHAPADTLQYWRFHGRNESAWHRRGAGNERYDYLYSADEIDSLADAIMQRISPLRDSFAFFNNHPHGKAAANAVQLAERLGLPLPYQKFAHLATAYPALRPLTGEPGGQLGLL